MTESERSWTVGALAHTAGITVRTLHHYDRLGLLSASGHTGGGHRRYTEPDVVRLYRILALRSLGIALNELSSWLDADGHASLLATARSHRERIEKQLSHHEQLRSRLDAVINTLELDTPPPTDALIDTLETMAMSVHLTRIYTRTGDDGQTDLADLTRVDKTDPRVEAVGAVDELNAALGLALAAAVNLDRYPEWLRQIQNDLFDLGADLSRPPAARGAAPRGGRAPPAGGGPGPPLAKLNPHQAAKSAFVLPGGTQAAAHLHLCRTVCRRAERRTLAVPNVNPAITHYLNRLSDLLFILSRAANTGHDEPQWRPARSNRSGGASGEEVGLWI